VIRAHPLGGQRTTVTSGLACAQCAGQPCKALLHLLELVEIGLRDLRRRYPGRERLEFRAHEERLPHPLARQRPHAHPAIWLERDEPERGKSPESLADRRAADSVPLGEPVLA